jgi:rubrerythrin
MNVFDFAMGMEMEGKAFYEKMAAQAPVKELRTIFTLLADSEQEHYDHLLALKSGSDPSVCRSMVLDGVREHFQDLVDAMDPASALVGDPDGYRHALKAEERSIKLYEEMAGKEPSAAASDLLRQLAEEERRHLSIMKNIFEFVEAPKSYLAWGEFSNLRDI